VELQKNGGGGYTSGVCEQSAYGAKEYNGNTCSKQIGPSGDGGSYYYQGYQGHYSTIQIGSHIGGQGGWDLWSEYWYDSTGGSGGIAGRGGNIRVSSTAVVYAYNGNKYTDDSENYEATNIYIQNGTPNNIYVLNVSANANLISDLKNIVGYDTSSWSLCTSINDVTEYIIEPNQRNISYAATSYGQGIGSGAGYIEVSNGTYTVDSSMN
jgi:hypothetical protein